jgi:deazaflavin-dependent oxidoreductase (nitroreductase family)
MAQHYIRPDWFTANLFNPAVALLTGLGISLWGSRILAVRGRKSGEVRTTPVNVLSYEGERYLVAPRGVTQWVRNIRASGEGELRLGNRREAIRVVELPDDEKVAVLRNYLRRWAFEVGAFFQGVGANASDDEIRRIAPLHPIFKIVREGGRT